MRMLRLDADIRCSVYQRFSIGWRYDKLQRTMKRAEWNDWLVMRHAAKSESDVRTSALEPADPSCGDTAPNPPGV